MKILNFFILILFISLVSKKVFAYDIEDQRIKKIEAGKSIVITSNWSACKSQLARTTVLEGLRDMLINIKSNVENVPPDWMTYFEAEESRATALIEANGIKEWLEIESKLKLYPMYLAKSFHNMIDDLVSKIDSSLKLSNQDSVRTVAQQAINISYIIDNRFNLRELFWRYAELKGLLKDEIWTSRQLKNTQHLTGPYTNYALYCFIRSFSE